jgi:hypothetical protein
MDKYCTDEVFVDLDHVAAKRQGACLFLITKRSLFSTQQEA